MYGRGLILATFLATTTFTLADEPSDMIQGNWLGTWEGEGGMGGKNVAQIYGLGRGEYQAIFTAYDSGEQDKGEFTFSIRGASTTDGKVVFDQNIDLATLGVFKFHAEIDKGKFSGTYSNDNEFKGTLSLQRVTEKPDAVGLKPLPAAVSLFDGKSLAGWQILGEDQAAWRTEDGVLLAPINEKLTPPKSGHLASRAVFSSALVHVEFRIPYLPEKRGEKRGAGGIFLLGQYEVQIVDSFGFPRIKDAQGYFVDTDALGAIYGLAAPTELPALPPGEWQAFDITMIAERTDSDGTVIKPAEITVQLNGKTIHERMELKTPTLGAPKIETAERPGLILQNAGQGVAYRNLWYVPLDSGR